MYRRPTTLLEKHGFLDTDRANPSHDLIQVWVLHNFPRIIQETLNVTLPEIPSQLKLEYPVVDRNNVVGFIDVFCQQYHVAIEVKTSIGAVGDLIRQIQFYRNYFTPRYWIVVSPDDRFREILKSQDILFYRYVDPAQSEQLVLW